MCVCFFLILSKGSERPTKQQNTCILCWNLWKVFHIHCLRDNDRNLSVKGGSLYRVVKKFGTLNEKLGAIIMKQVLLGLSYLHDHADHPDQAHHA